MKNFFNLVSNSVFFLKILICSSGNLSQIFGKSKSGKMSRLVIVEAATVGAKIIARDKIIAPFFSR